MDRAGLPLVDRQPGGQEVDPPPRPRRRPSRRALAAVAAALAVIALGLFALTRGPDTAPLTKADVNTAVRDGIADAQRRAAEAPPDAAKAYQAALPSMVTISTEESGGGRGTGAGVVASRDGSILTALHVVDSASSVSVTFADGTRSSASLLKRDEANDIAVLAPAQLPQVLVPAVLGGGAQVGDAVFALGHPLGLSDSLTAGVVSALDRKVRVSTDRTLDGLIQFDAAVNPGNSGGPLLNRAGQVVGIVTGLANPSQQSFFIGIGFAVPIATAGGAAGAPPQ
ncbi:MAG TPA: trypsin-like peptidase domain-containing protein [Pedococcus sp.]|nr:trypsin-like peptidase domain-containing protein [Pedococcus sp.]